MEAQVLVIVAVKLPILAKCGLAWFMAVIE